MYEDWIKYYVLLTLYEILLLFVLLYYVWSCLCFGFTFVSCFVQKTACWSHGVTLIMGRKV